MLNETFYIDGVDARNFGIYLQKPIEFSEARPVVEIQSIPGRNGDLVFETGSYENRTGIASCFCLQKDVEKAISAAGRFLMAKHGYRRLETSDDPDHFWLARIENSPAIAQRMRTLAPFEISFDCKPQRFLKSGEEKIVIPFNGGNYLHIDLFNNFGFPSKPLFHIRFGEKEIQAVGINVLHEVQQNGVVPSKRITAIGITDKDLYIDCDIHDAYSETGNQNKHIWAYDFPSFEPGQNQINVDLDLGGVVGTGEYVEITPRWWEL